MADLGFVGLGVMGGNIARRLLAAGHRVTGYNRTAAKAAWLVEAGLQLETSPRRVAEAADVVFSSVADTAALRAVAQGPDGIVAGLRPGSVYVDLSTVSPALVRELARQIDAAGGKMLDAPVSGSVATIRQGQLSFMVGGDAQVLERVRPILLDIGPKITHVGANGQGALMKLATNLQVAVQTLAFSESVLLAERGGIPRDRAVEVLLQSVVASPMLVYRGPMLVRPPEHVLFNVRMMLKDVDLALEAAPALGASLPTTTVARRVLADAESMGYAEQECSAVFDVLSRLGQEDAVHES
jgi:3-hydroxyisobutyrate dehydrogenase-like beta-hydroxyacid dehydrogenase